MQSDEVTPLTCDVIRPLQSAPGGRPIRQAEPADGEEPICDVTGGVLEITVRPTADRWEVTGSREVTGDMLGQPGGQLYCSDKILWTVVINFKRAGIQKIST